MSHTLDDSKFKSFLKKGKLTNSFGDELSPKYSDINSFIQNIRVIIELIYPPFNELITLSGHDKKSNIKYTIINTSIFDNKTKGILKLTPDVPSHVKTIKWREATPKQQKIMNEQFLVDAIKKNESVNDGIPYLEEKKFYTFKYGPSNSDLSKLDEHTILCNGKDLEFTGYDFSNIKENDHIWVFSTYSMIYIRSIHQDIYMDIIQNYLYPFCYGIERKFRAFGLDCMKIKYNGIPFHNPDDFKKIIIEHVTNVYKYILFKQPTPTSLEFEIQINQKYILPIELKGIIYEYLGKPNLYELDNIKDLCIDYIENPYNYSIHKHIYLINRIDKFYCPNI